MIYVGSVFRTQWIFHILKYTLYTVHITHPIKKWRPVIRLCSPLGIWSILKFVYYLSWTIFNWYSNIISLFKLNRECLKFFLYYFSYFITYSLLGFLYWTKISTYTEVFFVLSTSNTANSYIFQCLVRFGVFWYY